MDIWIYCFYESVPFSTFGVFENGEYVFAGERECHDEDDCSEGALKL